jgi:dienelactone hydrolase
MNEKFVIDVKLITEMSVITPCSAIRALSKPCLIFHGESDSMVPCKITKDCVVGCSQTKLICMPGMEHGFTDEADDDGESELSERNYQRIVRETVKLFESD